MLLKVLISLQLISILQCTNTQQRDAKKDKIIPKVEINTTTNGIKTTTTTIIGTRNVTWNGYGEEGEETAEGAGLFYAFRGIRYVQPPIGNLRFKDPQVLAELPEFIDAQYEGHDCPSLYATNASEDCLVLNVYTKNLTPNTLLPVVIFIHPGGLYVGSSVSSFLGPEYLLTKSIVLVTFNYRLGTLGFLNLGIKEIPGNAGFKDQVQALRWVQKYIKYFGGNAADVTLMGYSAGALSASLHLVSPMSQRLFHKAVIMSGSLPPQTILPIGEQMHLVRKQAQALKCTAEEMATKASILDCLNRYSGSEIAATLRSLFDFGKDNPMYLWLPVIEHDFGQERFLTADFYASMRAGNFSKVPLLYSFTDGEFCTSVADIMKIEALERRFYAEFEELAPKIFMYEGRSNASNITVALREQYLVGSAVNNSDFAKLCDLFSDTLTRYGAQCQMDLAAQYVQVYSFRFEYRGEFSNLDYETKSEARAEHLDDLMYLFKMQPHHFVAHDKDAQIVKLYTQLIWDFIENGQISYSAFAAADFVTPTKNALKMYKNFCVVY